MSAVIAKPGSAGAQTEAKDLTAGNLRVDVERYQAFVGEAPVTLTYQEFELLSILVKGRDRIMSFDDLIGQIWHESSEGTRRRLGVVICRLRAKISGTWPYRIQTVRGRGYGLTSAAGRSI